MLKTATTIALLTIPLFNVAANAENSVIPELDSALQTTLCQNNWSASIRAVSLLIGNPETTPDDREDLVAFRYQLQDWRATGAIAAEVIPDCEGVAVVEEDGIPIPVSVSSPPLNFEAAVQSVEEMNSPYSSFVPYAAPAPATFSRECWLEDQSGRRFDLAVLCNGQ
ncbi:MAG: hypothetical protein HC879_12935 [Leptolyngbyaceae cyanobacterium SL_5_9]|nr:hypothetical protein [Leptolyngbyaceae cyanobacterium SL_5_9]NJO75214.1 hypothetical protein [Leptolyngbyaceae cyanobacterium RM1_406_9]